jgi:hypothetical protein
MLGGYFELSLSDRRRFKCILGAPGNPRHSRIYRNTDRSTGRVYCFLGTRARSGVVRNLKK